MKFVKAIRHAMKVLQLRLQGAVVVEASWEATYMKKVDGQVIAVRTAISNGAPLYMDYEIIQNEDGYDECVLHYIPAV